MLSPSFFDHKQSFDIIPSQVPMALPARITCDLARGLLIVMTLGAAGAVPPRRLDLPTFQRPPSPTTPLSSSTATTTAVVLAMEEEEEALVDPSSPPVTNLEGLPSRQQPEHQQGCWAAFQRASKSLFSRLFCCPIFRRTTFSNAATALTPTSNGKKTPWSAMPLRYCKRAGCQGFFPLHMLFLTASSCFCMASVPVIAGPLASPPSPSPSLKIQNAMKLSEPQGSCVSEAAPQEKRVQVPASLKKLEVVVTFNDPSTPSTTAPCTPTTSVSSVTSPPSIGPHTLLFDHDDGNGPSGNSSDSDVEGSVDTPQSDKKTGFILQYLARIQVGR